MSRLFVEIDVDILMPKQIFISYSSVDRQLALDLSEALKATSNFTPWLDVEKLSPTDNWSVMCEQALQDSEATVSIVSLHSLNLQRVLNEWTQSEKLFLISHILEKDYTQMMPPHYSTYNVIFTEKDNYIENLITKLQDNFS